jgi:hypothetical protein
LQILHSSFSKGSHVFTDRPTTTTDSGTFVSSGTGSLSVEYCSFDESSLFELGGLANLYKLVSAGVYEGQYIQNVKIIGSTFNNTAYAFHINTLQLKEVYIFKAQVLGGSKLIQSYTSIVENAVVQNRS